ncbi:MAG: NAD(P)-dependent oxidoreductase [Gammaproteobacteria bacterium]|jgi:nucleoside-diphosphate-sugar epimerase
MTNNTKKIFFTGGNGFIGKNFSRLAQSFYKIYSPTRAELELTNSKLVREFLSNNKFDCVVHGAVVGSKRNCQQNQSECLEANLTAFENVFNNCGSDARFIQLGSGAEYGRPLAMPRIEESYFGKKIPTDKYGFAKFNMTQKIMQKSAKKAVNLHIFAVYGTYEDYQTRFISSAILRTLYGLPIVINQDVKFDYLHIDDLIKIICYFINNLPEYSHYNIGFGSSVKLTEIAEIVRKVLGGHNDIIVKNPGIGSEYSCDNNRLLDFIGRNFKFTSLQDGIKNLAQWYEKRLESLNKDWILNPI